MKTKLLLSLAFVLSGGLTGGTNIQAQATAPVVAGNTAFAVDLYGQLRTGPGNVFFSPYSLSTALAMTYGGARGETAQQMARTLHFNLTGDQLHQAFAGLAAELRAAQQQGHVQLAVANSLWPQQGFDFRPDYLALCLQFYGTAITPVDYKARAETARHTINAWVEDRTNQKIVELLKPGSLGGATRLALVNAIYFKGQWACQFEIGLTKNEPFHRSLEKAVGAPLMRQKGRFGYAEFPDLQVLELPYAGDDVSMIVLLPRQVDGLGALEAGLTAPQLTAWIKDLPDKEVNVFLPRFKVTAEFELQGPLQSLGMSDAFNGSRADFSGMDGRKDLYISKVVHQAFAEVNEEGTEAAAATAVVMGFSGPPVKRTPIPVFRADHPFLFLIRDQRTGCILFLGRVTEPTQ